MLLTAALDTIGQEENNLKNSTYDQALHVEIFQYDNFFHLLYFSTLASRPLVGFVFTFQAQKGSAVKKISRILAQSDKNNKHVR